jgi:MYXO-CTERM domain-containing protein
MILPSIVPPMDAGVDAIVDAPGEAATDAAETGPEDPTGDAGEIVDAAIYEPVPEGDPGLPSSPAGDASGCACSLPNAGRASPFAGLALAILLFRRAARRRA